MMCQASSYNIVQMSMHVYAFYVYTCIWTCFMYNFIECAALDGPRIDIFITYKDR